MWNRFKLRRKGTESSSTKNASSKTSTAATVTSDDQLTYRTKNSQSARSTLLRRQHEQSAISDVTGQLLESHRSASLQRQRSEDKRDDPLGLFVLHAPPKRSVDIIFIHGLGGNSRRTWCLHRNYDTFWPQRWLPLEEGLSTARVLTFGYNANFSSKKEKASLTIGDFANDLLFRMKYGENGEDRLGQVPIVVVAHSMGGLVFKKAFIHGHLNDEFKDIMSMVKAVLFLATPHRGTDLADALNKILTRSVFGHSPKDYVSELAQRSPTIDELNESFRHHASKLRIFSFYETLTTAVGPVSMMILDKHSAVLGYPGETSQALIANHHGVCKFASPEDPNYRSIVGALRSIVSSFQSSVEVHSNVEDDLKLVKELLGLSGAPEEDLVAGRVLRKEGTGEHFIQSPEFQLWKTSEPREMLWAHAPPGSGKSTLCTLAIDHLGESGHACAFFFFRHGHPQKQRISNMLRSLAYQMAEQLPSVRLALVQAGRSNLRLQSSNALSVWKQLYLSILETVNTPQDMFWVVDGLDESESSRQAVDFISAASKFNCRIRPLVFSRPQPVISLAMQKVKRVTSVLEFPLIANESDIRLVVSDEIDFLPGDEDFKLKVTDEITARSLGNFLWVNLILNRIVNCHRQDEVKRVLEASPDGMDQLYDGMLDSLANLDVKEDQALARIMLSWAMYAKSPVTTEQLFEPYEVQLRPIMDLKHTINHVCGQFVTITSQDKVALVHQSARQYLKKSNRQAFPLHPETSNEELLGKCLVALCNKNLRIQLNTLKIPHFLPYAATSWAFHLDACSAASNKILDGLVRFFSGRFPLAWIHYLAMSGNLSEVSEASQILASFVAKRRKVDASKDLTPHQLSNLALLESWAADLMKIPAKFGSHLADDPTLIYRCIPSLSPSTSAISQQFSEASNAWISISGIFNSDWDDCLARITASSGRALRLATSSQHLAVASDVPKGNVTLWDVVLFREKWTFNIAQRVTALTFSDSGSLLACCGTSKTCVWNLKDGTQEVQVMSPPRERAIEFRFTSEDSLLMVTDLRRIYRLLRVLDSAVQPSWTQLDSSLLEETRLPEGMWLGTPTAVSFNDECTHLAVAYRAFPLTIWSLDPPQVVARLRRRPKQGEGSVNSHTGGNNVVWHPSGSTVLGIYGEIIRWEISDDTYDIVKGHTGAVPHDIKCSPNGQVFMTGDVEGTIKIYDFSSMSLIYQLTSKDRVNRICFSPDSLRFYDLRGPHCNVWEPNCLVRLADVSVKLLDDTEGVVDSFWPDLEEAGATSVSFPASEVHADLKPGIVALRAGWKAQQLVAYAYDNGAVELYDPKTDTQHTLTPPMFGLGIDYLVWDHQQAQIAYSRSGVIFVKTLGMDGTTMEQSLTTRDVYEQKQDPEIHGKTRQLIFDDTGKYLLICGTRNCQVVALSSGQVEVECAANETETSLWLQHPSIPGRLLSFTTSSAYIYTWKLEKQAELRVESLFSHPNTTLHAVLTSYSPDILLFRTVTLHAGRPQYGFILLSSSALRRLDDPEENCEDIIQSIDLPKSIVDRAAHPVGILPDGRFMFLDKRLWVCTAQVLPHRSLSQHFFIPYDWVTSEGLRSCHTLKDGTVLLPTKGRVAIIHSDISDW